MPAFYFMFYEYFKGYFVRNDAKTYIQRIKKEEIEKLKENVLSPAYNTRSSDRNLRERKMINYKV